MDPILLTMAAGLIGSILVEDFFKKQRSPKTQGTIEDRIKQLTSSLQESTKLISQVESEISERSALVEKLKKDSETYEQIVKLKEADVEAIAQLLRGELKKEGNRSFWKGVAVNFLFFIFGLVGSIIIGAMLK
jgi:t-SNARE complex subunit (syntaxin)